MRRHTSTRFGSLLGLACGIAGLVGALSPPVLAEESPRTLLAVFAHADDEQVIMPLLSRYAREGVDVHLAIATDGQKGVREHAGIPAGEELATARAEEARCSCETLGIHPPVLIGLVDGELYKEENKAALVKEVTQLFDELKPDVVVTWGPDGVTGHTDHRLVSSIVVQVFQATAGDKPAKLFLAGLPAERIEALTQLGAPATGSEPPPSVAMVRSRYLPVRIAYEEEDGKAATEALACHKTQYTPEEMARMSGMVRLLEDGVVHLRPWFVDPGPVTDLFE
jgi:LmbE family N-acetylglucosaminyl deacetylase